MKRLFVDLDGALCDFIGGFKRKFGVGFHDVPEEQAWKMVKEQPDLWAELDPFPEAITFFNTIRHYQPIILTSVPKSSFINSSRNKRRWVVRYLGYDILMIPCIGGYNKAGYIQNFRDILVDDMLEKNLPSWLNNGGIAIHHKEGTNYNETLNKVERYMNGPNITIITAFFDLGRGSWGGPHLPPYLNRTTKHYFECFEALLNLDNDIVVFTSNDLIEKFKSYQLKKSNLVVVGFNNWRKDIWPECFEPIKKIQIDPEYQKMIATPWKPEYWSVDYVMVNMLKAYFVNDAINSGYVKTDLAAWIDFGYAKYDNCVPTKSWSYDFNPEKIHFFSTKKNVPPFMDVVPVIMTNDVWITGCHIVAGRKLWEYLQQAVYRNLSLLLSHNLIDDDQTVLYMCYCEKPELFEIHKIEPDNWFCMFKDWNNVNETIIVKSN